MGIVNSELLRLARTRFNKSAVVLGPAAGGEPTGGAGAPPVDPAAGAAGAAPPMDPAAAAMMPADPSAGGGMPPPLPAAPPAMPMPQAPQQQKLKPEQMMQMIDYRMYNMQQQLTAIMNAMGVQLPPEAIVLPPGSTSAPAPETALPGGQGAPTAAPPATGGDPAAAAGQLPQDVYAGPDPTQTGGAVAPIDPVKAGWWQQDEPKTASYIGSPEPVRDSTVMLDRSVLDRPADLQASALAASALLRSVQRNAR